MWSQLAKLATYLFLIGFVLPLQRDPLPLERRENDAKRVPVAPIVHCIRHAEGFHNLTVDNYYMLDPLLTPHGEEQCRQLSQSFPYSDSISLITVSPLRRTIYTALLSFPSPINDLKVPVIALPELQEIGDLACDTGSDLDVLSNEMADKPVDLSLVEKGWEIKEGRWAPTGKAIEKRVREARQWLRARPEKEIVLVAHGGLLHYLTEDWSGSGKYTGTGWANTEFRSYQFVDGEEGDNASFIETTESHLRRRGEEIPLTDAERLQLRETAKESWVRAGYIKSGI